MFFYGAAYQKSQSAVFMLPEKGVPSAVVGTVLWDIMGKISELLYQNFHKNTPHHFSSNSTLTENPEKKFSSGLKIIRTTFSTHTHTQTQSTLELVSNKTKRIGG